MMLTFYSNTTAHAFKDNYTTGVYITKEVSKYSSIRTVVWVLLRSVRIRTVKEL